MFLAFESLTKAYEKAKRVIEKEGTPHFFIRHLAELEDFTAEVNLVFLTTILTTPFIIEQTQCPRLLEPLSIRVLPTYKYMFLCII